LAELVLAMLCVSLKENGVTPPKNQRAAKSRPCGVVYKRGGRLSSMAAYRLTKAGLRFSTKALMPSFWSPVANNE